MRFLQWKMRGAHNRETHKGIVTETTMSQTEERGILPAQTPARELFAKTRLEGRYVTRPMRSIVRESKENSKDCAAGKASLSTLSRGLLLGFFLLAFPETLSRKGMGRDVFRILDYQNAP